MQMPVRGARSLEWQLGTFSEKVKRVIAEIVHHEIADLDTISVLGNSRALPLVRQTALALDLTMGVSLRVRRRYPGIQGRSGQAGA